MFYIDGTQVKILLLSLLSIVEEGIQKVNEITPNPWSFINELIVFVGNNIGYVIVGLITILALIKIIMGRL